MRVFPLKFVGAGCVAMRILAVYQCAVLSKKAVLFDFSERPDSDGAASPPVIGTRRTKKLLFIWAMGGFNAMICRVGCAPTHPTIHNKNH
jgi:hypothetical protein